MEINFNQVIDRSNTNSIKWDHENQEILPMWVADMDFRAPQPVIDALTERVQHGIYGYSEPNQAYFDAIINWQEKRNDWKIQQDWIAFSPGVVPAVNMIIRTFANPGEKVLVQTPVYYPFFAAIANNGCQMETNPMIFEDGKYHMDFEDLERKTADPNLHILILCSPHNPVGRVWTKEEMTRLGEICLKNEVLVISDEIHSDLILLGNKHTPFASISEAFAMNSITCMAPSKTFNLAGLQTSFLMIPNEKLRSRYLHTVEATSLMTNTFGITALTAAYTKGEAWLEKLLAYLESNLAFLNDFVEKNMPEIKVIQPEGMYLVWMDFRALGLPKDDLEELMLKEAKIWLDEGYIFGTEGEGFERINIACPRSTLEEGLNRILSAVKKHREEGRLLS